MASAKHGKRPSRAEAMVEAALRGEELSGLGPGDATARAIARCPSGRRLRTLALRFCGVGPAGARALAGSPFLSRLETLDLEGNDIGDAGAKALATSTTLRGLRRLLLGHDTFGARGSSARNSIGAKGALQLATSRSLSRLDALGLPILAIDPPLARALSRSPLARFLALFPGAFESSRASPDGKRLATVTRTEELWGDGPRAGLLTISGSSAKLGQG